MDVKVKQMIKIIEEDADSFARRAEMYYKRRPELMKLAEDFYRAYRALAERYGHVTGVLRFAHKTMVEAFPDKVKAMPANGRMSVNSGNDSDDLPPEMRDFDFASLMMLPDGFMSPDSKAGLDVLDDLFNSSGEEKSCFSHLEDEGFERALTSTEEAEKEAVMLQLEKSLERITDLELELAQAQENCRQLEERAKEVETEFEHVKKSHLELEAAREVHLLEFQKCLNEIEEVRARASKVENELKKDVTQEKSEKEVAVQKFSHCLGMMSNLQRKLQHVKANVGEIRNEPEVEPLDHDLENGIVSQETMEERWSFAEKLNLDLPLRVDDVLISHPSLRSTSSSNRRLRGL